MNKILGRYLTTGADFRRIMKNTYLRGIRRFGTISFGIIGKFISIIGALTPAHWQIEKYFWGVEDQYYPEVFYIVGMLPLSLLFLAFGVPIALDAGSSQAGSDEDRP